MQLMMTSLAMLMAVTFAFGAGTATAAHDHQHKEAVASGPPDVKQIPDCRHCGMDRDKFSHSRMLVTYRDGTTVGTCSLNCVVTEMKKNRGKEIKLIQVADYTTRALLDADKATWVIGGKKSGVMTPLAKWAFAERKGAETFIESYGGRLATFTEAMKLAEKDFE